MLPSARRQASAALSQSSNRATQLGNLLRSNTATAAYRTPGASSSALRISASTTASAISRPGAEQRRLPFAQRGFASAATLRQPRQLPPRGGRGDDEAAEEEDAEADQDVEESDRKSSSSAATEKKAESTSTPTRLAEERKSVESRSGSRSGGAASGGAASSSTPASAPPASSSGSDGGSTALAKQNVPTEYPQVLALPISRRPLFPGFYKAVVIKNPAVIAAIRESLQLGQPYIGAFLLKDEDADSDVISDLNKVHRVGVFAQITNVYQGPPSTPKEGKGGEADKEETLTAVLYPHRRITIDELSLPLQKQKQAFDNDGQVISVPAASAGESDSKTTTAAIDDAPHQDTPDSVVISESGDPAQPESTDKKDSCASDSSSAVQTAFLHNHDVSVVNVRNLETLPFDRNNQYIRASAQELLGAFKEIASLNPMFREQITNFSISQGSGNVFEQEDRLADFAAAVSMGEVDELQNVLEALNVEDRLQKALVVLKKELLNVQLQKKIASDVDSKIAKKQKEYYLHEQMKGIKKELGIETDGREKLVEKFKEKADSLRMPEPVRKVFDEEVNKLSTLEPIASEFNVTRGYLEWLTNIPWGVHSPENYSISNATKVLDDDHYGLKDVKDRILEFLAVGKLRGTVEGKIICLVGPPGVGKTSIGKSIARAVERQFFRFSVGGLHDVAEIKGHRRTYVGAMPGKAIQALKKVGTENPLLLIDEVDKIGRGHNGDPSSALLEMLDPEQNGSFLDHYMDVPVDLSRVLFVCTANTLDTIPQPLLDRMEVIEVSSYTADEKRHIAKGYLAPQAQEASGLKDTKVSLPDETIDFLIRHHARESGVRGLRKLLEKVYRKIAFNIVKEHGETVFPEPAEGPTAPVGQETESSKDAQTEADKAAPAAASDAPATSDASSTSATEQPSDEPKPAEEDTAAESSESKVAPKTTTEPRKPMKVPSDVEVTVTIDSLRDYIGPPVYHKDRLYTKSMPSGVSTGLGYLGNGSGSLMPIETTLMPGKGSLQLTGKLGDVIKESASIALSWVKSQAHETLGISKDQDEVLLEKRDVHLHMPEGAIGKEGPSAGVAFATSLVSLLTGRKMSTTLAMTGEVSLRGMVLPVGGLKEKLLAAHRAGIKTLILPAQNQPNVEADVPKAVLDDLEIHYVSNVWAALDVAFGEGPWSARAKELALEQEEDDSTATQPKADNSAA
ncbi:ATP-dependent Lon protease pim1 [Tilletia horrida]|nr:ATP-dependent Lon protease pim1 [Tilletia horrida]